jgi:hypothetical protein
MSVDFVHAHMIKLSEGGTDDLCLSMERCPAGSACRRHGTLASTNSPGTIGTYSPAWVVPAVRDCGSDGIGAIVTRM